MTRTPQSKARSYMEATAFALLLPIILPLILLVLVVWGLNFLFVHIAVRVAWLPRGKDILFVHSDSTLWKDFVASDLLPLVRDRAYVLNWSERRLWSRWSFPVHVFHTLGGEREYNPLIIVFSPLRTEYFRFWVAFKDAKKGDTATLNALMADLREHLR